jgi:hypothetical protein
MKQNIGSYHVLTIGIQDAENSNVSLSSYTLDKSVGNVFRLTTHDGQEGESKSDNVFTDAQERTGRE